MKGSAWLTAWVSALGVLSLVSVVRTVRADVASAETLFQEGRRLMAEGRTEQGCEKLAESQRLDPSSGTLLNLAACHAALGMTATAWAEFLAAERLAIAQRRPLRAAEAKARAAELKPKVSYLTLRVAAPPQGLTLMRDTEELGEAAIGVALPVDPGTHVIGAAAPGYKEWTTTVVVSQPGEHQVVEVPELEALSLPPPVSPPAPPGSATVAAREPAPTAAVQRPAFRVMRPVHRAGSGLPSGVWVAAGAGAAASVVAGVFGGLSLASYAKADSLCKQHVACSDDAMAARQRAENEANVTNAALGTAVVSLAVAAWLYFISGDSQAPGAHVGERSAAR